MGPIKILYQNLRYVPNQTQHTSLLTRPRPHSYREAIDPRNQIRNLELKWKHKMMQANPKRAILQQPKLVAWENGRTELTARSKSKSNHADQTNKATTSYVFHQALPMHDPRIHHRSLHKLQHQVKSTKRHCLSRAEHNTKQKASRQQIQAQIHGTN
jgi:hypothetical protein